MTLPANLKTNQVFHAPGDLALPAADKPYVTRSNNTIRIVVPGPAPGKPRMTRRDKWAKRPAVVRYRDWCDKVRAVVADNLPAVSDIMSLSWWAYYEPPRSWSKRSRVEAVGKLHRVKPDRDNIDKAVLDCLFAQDEEIAAGTLRKLWDWTARIEIEIVTK